MIIFKTAKQLQDYLKKQKIQGKTIGFVPTMGALHAGHLSLVSNSRQLHALTVVSIFVNPTQFNDPADFKRYPVTTEQDCFLLESTHADVLFLPSVEEIYPSNALKQKHYDLGMLEDNLEGIYRQGHFQGVCQVVERLLEIVLPDELFIGQKDYQQCMVIKRLIQLMKANIRIHIGKTLREKNGLAMSSRNMLLSEAASKKATAIYQQLQWIQENIAAKEWNVLQSTATQNLLTAGFEKIDYLALANAENLQLLNKADPNIKMVVLVAAFLDKIRLIDNLIVT